MMEERNVKLLDAELRKATDLPGLDDPALLIQYITGLQDSLQVPHIY